MRQKTHSRVLFTNNSRLMEEGKKIKHFKKYQQRFGIGTENFTIVSRDFVGAIIQRYQKAKSIVDKLFENVSRLF